MAGPYIWHPPLPILCFLHIQHAPHRIWFFVCRRDCTFTPDVRGRFSCLACVVLVYHWPKPQAMVTPSDVLKDPRVFLISSVEAQSIFPLGFWIHHPPNIRNPKCTGKNLSFLWSRMFSVFWREYSPITKTYISAKHTVEGPGNKHSLCGSLGWCWMVPFPFVPCPRSVHPGCRRNNDIYCLLIQSM